MMMMMMMMMMNNASHTKTIFTNEEVRANVQQAIGPHEDLLTMVKRCKLQWYGHVSCSPSCKAQ